MTENRIWIEQRDGQIAVRWRSGGMKRIQTCANEEQARSFAAGLEEGLAEAQRILVDHKPRLVSTSIEVLS